MVLEDTWWEGGANGVWLRLDGQDLEGFAQDQLAASEAHRLSWMMLTAFQMICD